MLGGFAFEERHSHWGKSKTRAEARSREYKCLRKLFKILRKVTNKVLMTQGVGRQRAREGTRGERGRKRFYDFSKPIFSFNLLLSFFLSLSRSLSFSLFPNWGSSNMTMVRIFRSLNLVFVWAFYAQIIASMPFSHNAIASCRMSLKSCSVLSHQLSLIKKLSRFLASILRLVFCWFFFAFFLEFERKYGWKGLLVEANPGYFHSGLRHHRKSISVSPSSA